MSLQWLWAVVLSNLQWLSITPFVKWYVGRVNQRKADRHLQKLSRSLAKVWSLMLRGWHWPDYVWILHDLVFYPTFAVFPVPRETRWARTTGDRVIIFRTRHTGETSIVATTCNKNIAVSPRKTSITNAAVIVHSIKASTWVKTNKKLDLL